MFDYHIHTAISFDSQETAENIVNAAIKKGLKEICFTDHYDYNSDKNAPANLFLIEDYKKAYENLCDDRVKIKRGVEFGLTEWNAQQLSSLILEYPFDFIIGSLHFVDGYDPYHKEYWLKRNEQEAFEDYLKQTLKCVKVHNDFDVLGHLNYVCKSEHNPQRKPLRYDDYADICDEIMKELIKKGKGMEINSSGVDRVGSFLPSKEFFVRFKQLGGEIVTIGSDAHTAERVGQYSNQALDILKDVFGYVCTFENRKPIFNKL